jgi:hypothetical protein
MRHFAIAAGFAFVITAMFALSPAKAEDMLKSQGKCWLNSNPNSNPAWAACPQEAKVVKVAHHKGSAKVSAEPPSRPRPAAEGGGRY